MLKQSIVVDASGLTSNELALLKSDLERSEAVFSASLGGTFRIAYPAESKKRHEILGQLRVFGLSPIIEQTDAVPH